jgi:hypothetical protein
MILRTNSLYGTAYNCPCNQRKDDCPLKELNHLSYYEKVIWVEAISKEKKNTILEHHKACSINRKLVGI